jgi:hypothetical protein
LLFLQVQKKHPFFEDYDNPGDIIFRYVYLLTGRLGVVKCLVSSRKYIVKFVNQYKAINESNCNLDLAPQLEIIEIKYCHEELLDLKDGGLKWLNEYRQNKKGFV